MCKLNKNASYSYAGELYQKILRVHTDEMKEFFDFQPKVHDIHSHTKYTMAPYDQMLINAVYPLASSLQFILKMAGRENPIDIKNIPHGAWFNFEPEHPIPQLVYFSIEVNVPCLLSITLIRPI